MRSFFIVLFILAMTTTGRAQPVPQKPHPYMTHDFKTSVGVFTFSKKEIAVRGVSVIGQYLTTPDRKIHPLHPFCRADDICIQGEDALRIEGSTDTFVDITELDGEIYLIMETEIWGWYPPVPKTKGRGIFRRSHGWNLGFKKFIIEKISDENIYGLQSYDGSDTFEGVLVRNYCGRSKWQTVLYEGPLLHHVTMVEFDPGQRTYKLHHFLKDDTKEDFSIYDPKTETIVRQVMPPK